MELSLVLTSVVVTSSRACLNYERDPGETPSEAGETLHLLIFRSSCIHSQSQFLQRSRYRWNRIPITASCCESCYFKRAPELFQRKGETWFHFLRLRLGCLILRQPFLVVTLQSIAPRPSASDAPARVQDTNVIYLGQERQDCLQPCSKIHMYINEKNVWVCSFTVLCYLIMAVWQLTKTSLISNPRAKARKHRK